MAISDADYNWALMNGGGMVVPTDNGLQWRSGGESGGDSWDITQADIDSMRDEQRQSFARQSAGYNSNPAFQQFTPDQVNEYTAYVNNQTSAPSWLQGGKGIYNAKNGDGGTGMWWGPLAAPHHTDNGSPLSLENLMTGQLNTPYGETAQSAWNDMRSGAAIMALPFAAAGGAALVGGGAAGAGATGIDASTGLFAGESATSGAAGSGVLGGGAGSGSLIGGAGSDTLGGSSMGEDGLDLTRLEDPSYWNPEGGTTGLADPGASGIAGSSTTYGSTDYMQAAKDMATQLGITPATALKYLLTAGGAALGAAKGGAKPAGTTTTTQDLPDWLKTYAQQNVAQGQQILQGINPNNPLLPASQNEAMKTIRGDYLDPSSNPYFASSVNDALGLAKSQYAGMYGGQAGSNINNSGFQEGLTRTLGQLATNAYSQNYQNERGRQATAAFGAPQLVSQGNAAQFSGNQAFQGLFPNVSSTTVPYFSNPIGNMFSGALGGYALGGGMGK